MRGAALTQFLVDVTRGQHKAAFASDPDAVLAASPLEDGLRAAIRAQDIGTLWLAGAHPMALMYFARSCGWANDRYYRCISDAELRRADPAGAARPAGPAPSQTHRPSGRHGP